MKKPIFYKCLSNNECYKLLMEDDIPNEQIDACLDAIGYKDSEFITRLEFEEAYSKTMSIDVYDTTDTYKIGTLTTKFIDMTEVEEDTNLNSL